MNTKIIKTIITVVLSLGVLVPIFSQQLSQGLSAQQVSLIKASVFEVVIKKPFDNPYTADLKKKQGREAQIRLDPLVYDQELAWDLVDFKTRTDEYISVGTAFASAQNRYITAAHVLNLESATQWNDYAIRDSQGKVFVIDQVSSYSNHRDFVEFSVIGRSDKNFLPFNTEFQLNSTVFAVGNALGEGVVIRDGLLTSQTKEAENGEWDFLRFSAAASPGNSGGPLLNNKAEVIGIVLRKSADENLNFALPIAEMEAIKPNIAAYHLFTRYRLLVTDRVFGPYRVNKDFGLPLNYRELRKQIYSYYQGESRGIVKKVLGQYQANLFPKGRGSRSLFHLNSSFFYPALAGENTADGNWDAFTPKDIKSSLLDDNGQVRYGSISNLGSFAFTKPNKQPLKELLDDSALFMKQFLTAFPLNRNFAGTNVRITDMGAPQTRVTHKDAFKRTWLLETWNLEFQDNKLLMASLPTPLGRVGMFFLGPSGAMDADYLSDLKIYLDLVFYSYGGTFAQWREFLALKEYLPACFEGFSIDYKAQERAVIASPAFSVNYGSDLLKISDNSYCVARVNYFPKGDDVVWDIQALTVWSDKDESNFFNVVRRYSPESTLPDSFRAEWKKLSNASYPYNKTTFVDNGNSYITQVHPDSRDLMSKVRSQDVIFYTVMYGDEGQVDSLRMGEAMSKVEAAVSFRQ